MSAVSCPSCGATLPEGAAACSYCGRRVPRSDDEHAPEAPALAAEAAATNASAPGTHTRAILLIALASAVTLGLGLLVAALLVAQPSGETAPQSGSHLIEYRVSGSVRNAILTYTNATGGTEQREVRLPWTRTLNVEGVPYVYIAALSTVGTGTITCQIRLDGALWKESTSSGTNMLVTCGGTPDIP